MRSGAFKKEFQIITFRLDFGKSYKRICRFFFKILFLITKFNCIFTSYWKTSIKDKKSPKLIKNIYRNVTEFHNYNFNGKILESNDLHQFLWLFLLYWWPSGFSFERKMNLIIMSTVFRVFQTFTEYCMKFLFFVYQFQTSNSMLMFTWNA